MRYLICESSWEMMALARDLEAGGLRTTGTDRLQDLPHLQDLLEAEVTLLDSPPVDLMLRLSATGAVAVVTDHAGPDGIARWFRLGAAAVLSPKAEPAEIAAHLTAIARRVHGLSRPVWQAGALQLDLAARRARLHGLPLALAPKVYDMLECLALRAGRLVSRDLLMSQLYGLEREPDLRVLDVYATALRQALSSCADDIRINTVRGQGYRMIARDAAQHAA